MRTLDQKSNSKAVMQGDRQYYTRNLCRLVTHLLSHKKTVTGKQKSTTWTCSAVMHHILGWPLTKTAGHKFGFYCEKFVF